MKSKCCCCNQKPCCCGQGSGDGNCGPPPAGWQPQPLGTWLLIRFDTSDTGARPIPSGDVWWTSPDIWVTGGDAYGNPIGGQPAVVHARIWNLGGLDAMPTIVNFSFIEPGLGLNSPMPIGTVGVLVPSASYAEATVPWIPPQDDQDVHSCIIVTCSCAVTNDVPSVPGNVVADRHTGQRNMSIIGKLGKMIKFQLHMTNLRPWTAAVQLGAHALLTNELDLLRMGVTDIPLIGTAVTAINRPHTQVEYRLLAARAALINQHPGHFTRLPGHQIPELVQVNKIQPGRVHQGGAVVPPPNRINSTKTSMVPIGHSVELKSLQRATVDLEVNVPPPDESHEWLVVHIAQITEGFIEGGYTVMLRIGGKEGTSKKSQTAAHVRKDK